MNKIRETLLISIFSTFCMTLQSEEIKSSKIKEAFSIEVNQKLGKPLIALKRPSKDQDGKLPTEVLVNFLSLVNTNKFKEAKSLCIFSVFENKTKGTIGHIYDHTIEDVDKEYQENAKIKLKKAHERFDIFALKLRKYPKHTVGFCVKQKSGFWSFIIKADKAKSQPWPQYLYMKKINKNWKIILSDSLLEMN